MVQKILNHGGEAWGEKKSASPPKQASDRPGTSKGAKKNSMDHDPD
jgi:hypothetical protein